MPVAYKNLSGTVQGLLSRGFPDIGQTYYVVDSNYRTLAQGWSRADRTGPLDLWQARNPGYVYRTDDYSTDRACIQAGIDAMIDFRGDTLFFTPGAYSLATALSIDVPDARWMGPAVSDPRLCRASITDTVGSACAATAAADRMEVGYLRFVPLTATPIWTGAAGMDNGHFHHFFFDTDGVAAGAGTTRLMAHSGATMNHWKFSDFLVLYDADQGPLVSVGGAYRSLSFTDFEILIEAGTVTTALLTTVGTASSVGPVTIQRGRGSVSGGGACTNLVLLSNSGTDTARLGINDFRGQIGFCASGGLVALGGDAAATVGLANCYLDVVSAGAGGAGTTYTA